MGLLLGKDAGDISSSCCPIQERSYFTGRILLSFLPLLHYFSSSPPSLFQTSHLIFVWETESVSPFIIPPPPPPSTQKEPGSSVRTCRQWNLDFGRKNIVNFRVIKLTCTLLVSFGIRSHQHCKKSRFHCTTLLFLCLLVCSQYSIFLSGSSSSKSGPSFRNQAELLWFWFPE